MHGIDEDTKLIIDSFIAESHDLIEDAELKIADLEGAEDEETVNVIFRLFHSIKGSAGYLNFKNISLVTHEAETLLDLFRKKIVEPNPDHINLLYEAIDLLKHLIIAVEEKLNDKGFEEESKKIVHYLKEEINKANPDLSFENTISLENKEDEGYTPIGEILKNMGVVDDEELNQALDVQEKKVGEILEDMGVLNHDALDKALDLQSKVENVKTKFNKKSIKVDKEKLDTLFNLVGELITAKSMVTNNHELEDLILEDFHKSANILNKITKEIQDVTMSLSMIPIGGVFNKMRRLVRSLSQKFKKNIHLHISGENTEIDKNLIEELSDPLVHIIRNAIDHGIEDEKTRLKNGKEINGNIFLDAKYEGNEIWIIIKDDGGGLNKSKIIKKAKEKGLLKNHTTLTDNDIFNLIFEPGFSTADQISDVSGRGVGMDVVKMNIEKVRGKIDIESEEGKGTTMTIKIPLTMAIIEGMTVEVDESLYSIPTEDIVEVSKLKDYQVTEVDPQTKVINYRGEIIPLVNINDYLITQSIININKNILIILQGRKKKIAILINGIRDTQQLVIKSLPEFIGDIKGLTGCSILPNGDVSFIIDIKCIDSNVLHDENIKYENIN